MRTTTKKLIENKTPGSDGISNIAVKVAARTAPRMFTKVFTADTHSKVKQNIGFLRQLAPWKSKAGWQKKQDKLQTGWIERNHGKLNYELTQFLSEHEG